MRAYLRISGVLFGVITLLHILRLLLHWSAQIADWAVPAWVSWIAMLGAAALCTWAFRLVRQDRKSTRLNSSHTVISYAVFCLKKKKTNKLNMHTYNITQG